VSDVSTDDRQQLHELAARYANTIDARDWKRFETVFTPDCRYELRNFGRMDTVVHGAAALREYMMASTTHPVAHHVTNVEVDASGKRVRMLSKILGTLPGGSVGSADYHDIVVKSSAGWQIAERVVTLRRPPQ
jgi:hypothetical protein